MILLQFLIYLELQVIRHFFIDKDTTIEQIKSKLEELNSLMNHDSEEMLKEYIKNMK